MTELNKRIAELTPEKRQLLARLLKEKGTANPNLPIISRPRGSNPLPLSYAQQRLWFLDQLSPGNAFYNVNMAIPLAAELNPDVLERSFNEIVRRHESLRTSFKSIEGQPVQIIAPQLKLKLEVVDLRELPFDEREQEFVRLGVEDAQRPFDLSTLPLLRTTLVRLADEDHVLLLTMHHIVTDAVSLEVLMEELTTVYDAYSSGLESPLAELPLQYGDYAAWQRDWLQGSVLSEQLRYWREQLSGLSILHLPTDYIRPAASTYRGSGQSFELPQSLSMGLEKLSQQEGATLFMTTLAAFAVLLSRYSGQTDIAIGTHVAGRNRAELERLIGFFVNTLVLRADLSGNPGFREALRRMREVALEAYAHQEVPFERLVEELHPERDLSRNPLFQVSFQLLKSPGQNEETTNSSSRSVDIERETSMFDLGLELWETAGGLKGSIEYSTDLFEAETIKRMLGHYRQLLESAVANPDTPVSQLQMLTEDERHEVVQQWNETATPYEREVCLHELFERQAALQPEAVAVRFEQEQLTYGELNRRANQLAHYLRKQGVGAETFVGICVERSIEMVVAALGVLKAGGAYVPLDPAYPRERLQHMLRDTATPLILTQQHLIQSLPFDSSHVISLDTDWKLIENESVENLQTLAVAENAAVVIYTSGSTGRSKGVILAHRGLCNRLLWGQKLYQLSEADRVLQAYSFSFDFSVWEIFTALTAGAQLVITRPGGHQDSAYLVRLIAERQITLVGLVPSMLDVLLAEPEIEACGCLKIACCGGEVLPVEFQERFFARLNGELQNTYGPTEASIDVTCWICRPEDKQRTIPIGRPIANTQLYLLDSHLQPVPVGVSGEIYIGGDSLARGYLNDPAMTAGKFIPDFLGSEPGARLYKTGDLARYRADGNIEFLGRLDNQIKLRGFRIELGEIESVLSRHAGVREAVISHQADAAGEKRLIAYVIPDREHLPGVDALQQFMKERLPAYMTPSAIVFLESLPLTANGKIDYRALPAFDHNWLKTTKEFVAPRTQTEKTLAHIWAEVLGIERVGINDNFFELGGHSLLATQIVLKARAAFKVELPLRNLFETPTIAGLAANIEQSLSQGDTYLAPSIRRLPRELYRGNLSPGGVLEISQDLRRLVAEMSSESAALKT